MKKLIVISLMTISLLSIFACGITVNNDDWDEQILLYNVNFNNPPHIPNSEPVVGTQDPPRDCPSQIVFGHPTVVDSFGLFFDNSCVFTSEGIDGYAQLQFTTGINYPRGFTEEYDRYHIEMDILVEYLVDDFTILLDRPTVQNIYFHTDKQINTIDLFTPYIGTSTIGEFEFDVPIHLEIDLNVLEDKITICIDDEEVYDGSSDGCEMLQSVRINLESRSDSHNIVALDNFRILGSNINTITEEKK